MQKYTENVHLKKSEPKTLQNILHEFIGIAQRIVLMKLYHLLNGGGIVLSIGVNQVAFSFMVVETQPQFLMAVISWT